MIVYFKKILIVNLLQIFHALGMSKPPCHFHYTDEYDSICTHLLHKTTSIEGKHKDSRCNFKRK